MKIKLFILGLSLGISILSGCNDVLTQVGTGIQPDGDKPAIYTDTFHMAATTQLLDSVYARTTAGSLGEIYDPLYGNLKSDYLCQFYCPDGFRFAHTPANGKIDSVNFKILYNSWIGDSLTPMRVQLYQVTESLPRDFYTNINPEEYCNKQITLGMQTYTSYDMSVPDSIRFAKINDVPTFQPNVTIRLAKELGQKFYDESVNNPGSFKNQNTFNDFFPGIYITNTFGTGNILNVDYSRMFIYYKYIVKGSAGQDSLVQTAENFNVTSEVIQLNRFKNTDMSQLLEPNDSLTYLKTPAGVYTRLVIPAKEMAPVVEGRIISNLALALKALPQENWQYAFAPPANLLVLPEDSVDTFFKSNNIENNITAFLGTYSVLSRTYSFGNIANLLENHIKKAPANTDLVMRVIPVERVTGKSQNYMGQTTEYTVAINNYLKPSGVKLRKDKAAMEVHVTTIKYKN